MAKKRLRMFAGPNGSGKSVLIEDLIDHGLPLKLVVNADNLLEQLEFSGKVDFSSFHLDGISQEQWHRAIRNVDELSSRVEQKGNIPTIDIVENVLVCKDAHLNAYAAALITDFIRHMLIRQGISFSFETVMSHSSKVKFLNLARRQGYKVYLYYLATSNSAINVDRVRKRVQDGGHNVPYQKIKSRYKRSLELLYDAYEAANRVYIIDGSTKESSVVYEKKANGTGGKLVENLPLWVETYLIDKLPTDNGN